MPKNEFTCDCCAVNEALVAQAQAQMPEEAILQRTAAFFKILGDPTRCKLICALLQQELCVCDLANVLSMTKSSISHQLSKMRQLGVVKCRRAGKEVYYSLDDHHVEDLLRITLTHVDHHEKEIPYEI